MEGLKNVVLYHYPCTDGIFAAYMAKLAMSAEFHPHSTPSRALICIFWTIVAPKDSWNTPVKSFPR